MLCGIKMIVTMMFFSLMGSALTINHSRLNRMHIRGIIEQEARIEQLRDSLSNNYLSQYNSNSAPRSDPPKRTMSLDAFSAYHDLSQGPYVQPSGSKYSTKNCFLSPVQCSFFYYRK
uniref:Secreted protein n=1 Tax=Rhabditophanes sp. KR3021 TaxID=114890 RepID=A0AC35TWT4_9BILA